MKYAGIDIGSRTIEFVVINDGNVVVSKQTDTGFDPVGRVRELLKDVDYDRMMATGYGRYLMDESFGSPVITEIKAYAAGANALNPEAHTILDIGGQDSKVIVTNSNGRVIKFEMNDKCAAGTGKFMEIMAQTLGYTIDELGTEALKSSKNIQINSTCTVFAESEVTALISKGQDRRDIALGLHKAVVKRSVSMLNRISSEESILFAGGVARNPCIVHLLKETLQKDVWVPDHPQMVGALGAAILAKEGMTASV